ncbi:CBS domain-containing protein [Streptomyces canus]|uniref:CBS domain-containing protein n=1 Tax=Streptomyces canus TaxID=58343 RepID=UPI002E29AB68|nr:CBS domain-containing protein [Streptomyces canus]
MNGPVLRDRWGAHPCVRRSDRRSIVSEADLLPKEEFRDSDPDRYAQLRRLSDLAKAGALTAEELMTSPALTTRPNTTLAQAARIRARAKIKRLPVVDEQDILQGIVSRADLLKVFLRDDEELAQEVRREVVAYLLPAPGSAICVDVHDGVVKLVGRVRDTALIPVAARLVRAVEGVVDTDFELKDHGNPCDATDLRAAQPRTGGIRRSAPDTR